MKYRFSFTAVGLTPAAMQDVAALYLDCESGEALTQRTQRDAKSGDMKWESGYE